jgi:GTPase SAR1 family protein
MEFRKLVEDIAAIVSLSSKHELPGGMRLRHTLRGHTDVITGLSWSPDGRMLASCAADNTVRVWNAETGNEEWQGKEHSNIVYTVAWSSNGLLASGAGDKIIRLWSAETGQLQRTLKGHDDRVFRVTWSPDGKRLASGSADNSIRLWDSTGNPQGMHVAHYAGINDLKWSPDGQRLASGSYDQWIRLWNLAGDHFGWQQLLWEGKGHNAFVTSLAWSGDGNLIASASDDATVQVWDAQSGKQKLRLEQHTGGVTGIAFSNDASFLASKAKDHTVILFRSDSWQKVGTLPESHSGWWEPPVAFHPHELILATLGEKDTVIRIWDLDREMLFGKAEPPPVTYTSAKIVLVGDSGIGKTGLGWRMTYGSFKEHSSTHGQQFWLLDQLSIERQDGTQCEAILWDLAGQPDYRLTNALFVDDADLALVLFDPTDRRDPLHGVEFWLKQLGPRQARSLLGQKPTEQKSFVGCPTILVAARTDRGTAMLTREELEAFCNRHGIRDHIATSAKNGDGVDLLIQRMKALIPWTEKAATVTTGTFKRIKDYVLKLKENRGEKQIIVSPEELRGRLKATDDEWEFSEIEMMTAVGHLENHGYVKLLRTSKGTTRILLAPEVLNNLAASFVLEARRNPKELGSIEEKKLLTGKYSFPELAGLSPDEHYILLDSAVLLFLEHNICFRETDPLTSESYLVFPDLINLKKPMEKDQQPTEESVSYTVIGAVENVYASLVVLLGYTHTFTRTNQWQNHARYEVGDGLVCAFRLDAERDGELDFVLYFGTKVGRPVRMLFQGLFESFLARRNLTVFRYEPVTCQRCGAALERAVVRTKLREHKTTTFCSDCGEKLALSRADEPIQLSRQQEAEVQTQRSIAEQRTHFEQAIFRLQSYLKQQGIKPPECFISYAWGQPQDERWVERNLAADLQKAGIDLVLDRWENAKIGASVARFVERIEKCDRVIVVGTPLYRKKYENKDTTTGYVVAAEVDVISTRLLGTEAQKETVLPVLLSGEKTASLPPLLHGRVYADFRKEEAYFTTAFDLIFSLYQLRPNDPVLAELRESLRQADSS